MSDNEEREGLFMLLIRGDVIFRDEPTAAELTMASRVVEFNEGGWVVTWNGLGETGQQFKSESDAYDFITSPW